MIQFRLSYSVESVCVCVCVVGLTQVASLFLHNNGSEIGWRNVGGETHTFHTFACALVHTCQKWDGMLPEQTRLSSGRQKDWTQASEEASARARTRRERRLQRACFALFACRLCGIHHAVTASHCWLKPRRLQQKSMLIYWILAASNKWPAAVAPSANRGC